MLPHSRTRRLAMVSIAVAVLTACGPTPSQSDHPADPQRGGTLRVALDTAPSCWDPTQAATVPVMSRQMVDNLTDQDPETGQIVPWLARGWTVDEDATTYTFDLVPDVTFSSGEPFDAAAVKANFDTVITHRAALNVAAVLLTGYIATEVDSPTRARVRFDRPNVGFLQAVSTLPLGMIAPSSLALDPLQRCARSVTTTGPFTVESISDAETITLARRLGYAWPPATAHHQGETYLDRIEYRTLTEVGVREGTLRSHQIDLARVDPVNETLFDGDGFALAVRAQPGIVNAWQFNATRPLLQDARVRRALILGIDRAQIVDTVLGPHTAPATSILAPITLGYSDLSALIPHDLAQANRLLDEAGWTRSGDGIRSKDGRRLSLRYIARFKSAVPDLVYQQWREIGVELDITGSDATLVVAAQNSGDWDINAYSVTRSDPAVLSRVYATGGPNGNRLPPSPLDDLLAGIDTEPDPTARARLATAAQRYILEHGLAAPINDAAQVWAHPVGVHGIRYDGTSFPSLYDTWKN